MSKTMGLSWSTNRRRYEFAWRMKIMMFDTICVFALKITNLSLFIFFERKFLSHLPDTYDSNRIEAPVN